MANIDRRTFLRATTAIAAGAVTPELTLATTNKNRELMAAGVIAKAAVPG